MTIIHRYLFRKLLVATCIATLGVCGPLILLSVLYHVPSSVFYSSLIWSVIYGIVPTTVFLTLPVAVAIGTTWTYARLASDFAVATLYSARFSTLSVMMPGLVFGALMSGFGLFLSAVVAPHSVGHVHDVLHILKHDLQASMLEPEQIYKLNDGRHVLSIRKWIGPKQVQGVFLQEHDPDKQEERTLLSNTGEFVEFEQHTILVLQDGVVQVRNLKNQAVESFNFNQMTQVTGLRGTHPPRRDWAGVFEYSSPFLIQELLHGGDDRGKAARLASEAVKRFCVPILAFVHALLGMGLVIAWGTVVSDDDVRPRMFYGVIVLLHSSVLVIAEAAVNVSPRFVWLALGLIAFEFAVALLLVNLRSIQFWRERRQRRHRAARLAGMANS